MGKWRISGSDPAVDGHPCEAAISFRNAIVKSEVSEEVPADVVDLAIHFAWIGKAITRTNHLKEWLASDIDPNTRDVITALSIDSFSRQKALSHAADGKAAFGMEASLKDIRQTKAFINAINTVRILCTIPTPYEIQRLSHICDLSLNLGDEKRLHTKTLPENVASLHEYRMLKRDKTTT